jgi:hypothetical protein
MQPPRLRYERRLGGFAFVSGGQVGLLVLEPNRTFRVAIRKVKRDASISSTQYVKTMPAVSARRYRSLTIGTIR